MEDHSADSAGSKETPRRLSLIFAIDKNGVIGNKGQLPWDHPEDRDFFLHTTEGHVVIMGRRTWEERGTPLPGRTNIVVSGSFRPPPSSPDVLSAKTLDDALEIAWRSDDEPFVIGGARMFEEAMPRATRIYMTEVPGEHQGDTTFHFDPTGASATEGAPVFRLVHEETTRSGLRFLVFEPLAPPEPGLTSHRAEHSRPESPSTPSRNHERDP